MDARHCLVTGANRGLGLEFTRQLLARGDRVVASARHPGKATDLNALSARHPGYLRVLPLDVAEPKSIDAFAAEADAEIRWSAHKPQKDGYALGVQFTEMDDKNQRRLRKFLTDLDETLGMGHE